MSIKLSYNGLKLAEGRLGKAVLTKTAVAEQLAMARSTVSNFFAGKKVSVEHFFQICDLLGLDAQEVSETDLSVDQEFENLQAQKLNQQHKSAAKSIYKSTVQERLLHYRFLTEAVEQLWELDSALLSVLVQEDVTEQQPKFNKMGFEFALNTTNKSWVVSRYRYQA
jgi:plasmid maintenance system antidote protein VapI